MRYEYSDVVIIGYGPVSRMLAILLGELGHAVTVLERHPQAYPLPRAVCMDHEIHRALQAHQCIDNFSSFGAPSPRYQWLNQDWKTLLDIDWTVDSISGGPQAYFFHQPSLETALDQRVRSFPNVNVRLEQEAQEFTQTSDGISVKAVNAATGETVNYGGRYLIGADGANSAVRNSLGITWEDRGFQADWLVVDVMLNDGVELDIPPAGQHCNPERPTTFVPGGMIEGKPLRRWEIMRLPHETCAQLNSTDYVWELLSRWVTPEQATLVRHAVYTFRSLVAQQWRDGRVFLVGDAAHTMPPFMGQGMCSGIRDALNLGWRLDLVLKGTANGSLLDDYEVERKPHITEVIDASVYLGEIVCISEADKAAQRDQAFFNGSHTAMPAFPYLRAGTLGSGSTGLVGTLSPHANVRKGERDDRLDRILGSGFTLLLRDQQAYEALSSRSFKQLQSLNAAIAVMAADWINEHAVDDYTGKLSQYFADNGLVGLIVRPDHYIFATAATDSELDKRVSELHSAINQVDPIKLNQSLSAAS